jgi:N utilization substance protein B
VSSPRRQAREAALRILYLCDVGRVAPDTAVDLFFREHSQGADAPVVAFARMIVLGAAGEAGELDALISRHSAHWRLDRLAVIDRLILRMAAWELRHEPETPAAVVLNEAVELARRFSSPDAARFVNGVLDGILRASSAGEPDHGQHRR